MYTNYSWTANINTAQTPPLLTPSQRLFVWIYLRERGDIMFLIILPSLMFTRFPRPSAFSRDTSHSPIHYSLFPIIPIVHTYSQKPLKKCAFLHKNRTLPKGKMEMIGGSNRSLNFHPPSLFLLKHPVFCQKIAVFRYKNDCLDIIESLFLNSRTPHGRFFQLRRRQVATPYVGDH